MIVDWGMYHVIIDLHMDHIKLGGNMCLKITKPWKIDQDVEQHPGMFVFLDQF